MDEGNEVSVSPTDVTFSGRRIPVHTTNTLVVGSGAAARNAALQLVRHGVRDVAIVTERWNAGTSYNAGSDKQTYYKLSLAGASVDSPQLLAHDLWAGGCMHGDIALCESNHSAQAFYNLVELGVPFPHDRHGGYAGYRTDNDSRGRATSAGPLTSKLMCEYLGRALAREDVSIFDRHQVIALLMRPGSGRGGTDHQAVCGAVALDTAQLGSDSYGLVAFNAQNVVLATGGPGGMYKNSVYPQSQLGSTGLALKVGAIAHNLTESQFGLASVGFRWNLSGSYQQVIPRYLSTATDGSDEREFLNAHFPDMPTLANATFRKGYEWPFDCNKVTNHGSSLIDLLVHRETESLGRKVFLDYVHDPRGGDRLAPFELSMLDDEARNYLERSGALQETPIARLLELNEPAVELFRAHKINLAQDWVEVAVCAQHNNGGLRANLWWESNLRHLFPVGEVCGTHGVRRPGGAALNSGQVGSLRAALYIAQNYTQPTLDLNTFKKVVAAQIGECVTFCARVCDGAEIQQSITPALAIGEIQERMSRVAAHVRDRDLVDEALTAARELWRRVQQDVRVSSAKSLPVAFRAADLCLTHLTYLEAIQAYLKAGGYSRGSVVVLDPTGELPATTGGDQWRFRLNEPDATVDKEILEIQLDEQERAVKQWVPVRPMPSSDEWFETVWRDYRAGNVIE